MSKKKIEKMIATKKQLNKAGKEANLLQWVDREIMDYVLKSLNNSPRNIMETAEKIIKRIRNSKG